VQVLVVGLSVLAALLVVAAAIVVPRVVDDLADDDSPVVASRQETSLEAVLVVADLSTEHRDDEDIAYEQVPPIGGPHDDEWLACGAYDEPVRDENAVHDLEHGTVWITYDPELADEAVATLEEVLPDDGIMSPYPGLPAPVVITVWGAQLRLRGPDDPRLPHFLEEFGDGSTAPEALASCEGGVTDPQGGPEGVAV
jgi:hypothetical protein